MCGDDASIDHVSENEQVCGLRSYLFKRTINDTPALVLYVNNIYHIIPWCLMIKYCVSAWLIYSTNPHIV